MNPGDLFNNLLLAPMINLLVVIIRALEAIHLPGVLGFSIMVLTTLVTLVTWPFRTAQIKSAKKTAENMALIKPKLEELKKKYKDDKLGLSQAQAALYKEHGVNPTAAGCLVTVLPIVLIFPLYQTIFAFFSGDNGLHRINYFLYNKSWQLTHLPDLNFFGANLASKPSEFAKFGFWILLIPVITGLLTMVQSKMMTPVPVKKYPSDSPKEKKEKESTEDAMQAVQGQMTFMMPLMIGYFAFTFPIGLAIYWNTLTILGIVQQYVVAGWGGFSPILQKLGLKR